MQVVGIMSGTSLDGIDFVLCQIDNLNCPIQYKDHASTIFPEPIKKHLLALASGAPSTTKEIALLHHQLGRLYAKDLQTICQKKKWQVDLIGLHGQTVFHQGGEATLQLGESSYMVSALQVPVVADFRPLDLAFEGLGAPLAGLFHQHLVSHHVHTKEGDRSTKYRGCR